MQTLIEQRLLARMNKKNAGPLDRRFVLPFLLGA